MRIDAQNSRPNKRTPLPLYSYSGQRSSPFIREILILIHLHGFGGRDGINCIQVGEAHESKLCKKSHHLFLGTQFGGDVNDLVGLRVSGLAENLASNPAILVINLTEGVAANLVLPLDGTVTNYPISTTTERHGVAGFGILPTNTTAGGRQVCLSILRGQQSVCPESPGVIR